MNEPDTSALSRRRPVTGPGRTRDDQQSLPSLAEAGRAGARENAGSPYVSQRHGNRGDSLLTEDELAILRLTAEGLPLYSVARHVGMSPRTVRRRLRNLGDRLGVAHPIQAIVWAARHRLI
jgi:DNA-binding NarL/FixJ family response regulator